VGHYVDPSSERSAVMPMLKQHQARSCQEFRV
jgi:hypothetical protein